MWAPIGQRPIGSTHIRYQWIYLYAFVHPADGRTSWMIMPTVNTTCMNIALQSFVTEANPDGNKILLLLIDQAGFHTGNDLVIPDSVIFFPLPPYTPELQPTECVWPLARESLANVTFLSLDDLQDTLVQRCQYLIANPKVVQGGVGFGWIKHALKQVELS